MIKYSLEDKNLIIELNVPELDHHITNEVRDGIDNVLNSNDKFRDFCKGTSLFTDNSKYKY